MDDEKCFAGFEDNSATVGMCIRHRLFHHDDCGTGEAVFESVTCGGTQNRVEVRRFVVSCIRLSVMKIPRFPIKGPQDVIQHFI